MEPGTAFFRKLLSPIFPYEKILKKFRNPHYNYNGPCFVIGIPPSQ
jgi:hypothetical protein